jgi:2-oxoacid:acceptor oxidoreductase gamma subunit (pyruvate/2-ketoisovalerate family)
MRTRCRRSSKEVIKLYEVRFHGRGGQGAVTAANILAAAAFMEGKDVQAFPMFGVERRGAPVAAFLRMDEQPIEIKTQIYKPDAVIVLDPTLMDAVDVTAGLKENGVIVVNSSKDPKEFGFKGFRAFSVDATKIAVDNKLGTVTNPIVNTAILGAYSRAVGNVKIETVVKAIGENAPVKKDENMNAAKDAYNATKGG